MLNLLPNPGVIGAFFIDQVQVLESGEIEKGIRLPHRGSTPLSVTLLRKQQTLRLTCVSRVYSNHTCLLHLSFRQFEQALSTCPLEHKLRLYAR